MQKKLTNKFIEGLKPNGKQYIVCDTELKGLVLRVQPSGLKFYYARYRVNGRQSQCKVGDGAVLTPAEARDRARKIISDSRDGIDPAAARKITRAETLKEFIEGQYKEWVTANRRSGAGTVARLLEAFPKDVLDKELTEITPWLIEKWKSARVKEEGANKASGNRDLACLKAALSKAVEWGLLTENPIKAVKLAKTDTKKTIRTMTDAEETALLDCLDKRDSELRRKRDSYSLWCRARHMAELPDLKKVAFTDHLRPMILVLLHTGIRRGELFSLEWRDVDLDSAMLTVRGEIAKSGKTRNVPLNGVALETFKAWCKQTDEDGLVFVSPDTGGRFDNIQSGWEAICEKAKIKGLRIHDLRHTFATRCLAAGADIAVVKELLGHQDISTTAIYLHPSEENKAAAVARLAVAKNVVAFQGKTETA